MVIDLLVPCFDIDSDFNCADNIDYLSDLNELGNNIIGYDAFKNKLDCLDKSFEENQYNDDYDDRITYKKANCYLYDLETKKPQTIDFLIENYKNCTGFWLLVMYNEDNSENEAIEELKEWIGNSTKTLNYQSNNITEEQKIMQLPNRTFKMTFGAAKANLINCKCFISQNNLITMYVSNIEFVV